MSYSRLLSVSKKPSHKNPWSQRISLLFMLEAENCYVIHVSACEKPNEIAFKDELRQSAMSYISWHQNRSYYNSYSESKFN